MSRALRRLGYHVFPAERANALETKIISRLLQVEARLTHRIEDIEKQAALRDMLAEDRQRDALLLLKRAQEGHLKASAVLQTEHSIAIESDDHIHPWGTMSDNTRHPRFVAACEKLGLADEGQPIRHLDLGCAGGGLVWEFVLRGHDSYGVEGSDHSLKWQRAEWRLIADRLFTADITEPFAIIEDGLPKKFDLVTAWEVLEHLPREGLPGLFDNLLKLLRSGGIFVCSVATFEDENPTSRAVYHQTVQSEEWWHEAVRASGLIPVISPFEVSDYVRGSDNPRRPGWDVRTRPDLGFHLVCQAPGGAHRLAPLVLAKTAPPR
jgi:SAM-dependent methyltransferase